MDKPTDGRWDCARMTEVRPSEGWSGVALSLVYDFCLSPVWLEINVAVAKKAKGNQK